MAEDPRDFIDQTQSRAKNYLGKELSPAEMATEFAKWGIADRVNALERLSADGSGELTVQEAARRYSFENALRNTHETLRKVGR